ncbi:MAG: hypothetical protein QNJ22_16320 [Desulfosarcinaceae bacterium]|nr:hypothetical protein [Desulfosarcinaceae bacterium]
MNLLYHKLLLLIFAIHLFVFARLALRTHRGDYGCLVVTFGCLVVMTSFRIWAADVGFGGVMAWELFRWGAWAFTFMAGLLWLRRRRPNGHS